MTDTSLVRVPDVVAYFGVSIPISSLRQGDGPLTQQARTLAERYLYAPAEVADLKPDYGNETFVVTVRVEAHADGVGRDGLARWVQNQRDRFASGLYATTEPVFLATEGN